MDLIISILIVLLIGGIIGWLASIVMNAKKGSLLRYIICGILGCLVGWFVHDLTSISYVVDIPFIRGGLMGLLFAIGGACVIILIARILKI
ncbi:MAG: hypothetical protein FWC71_09380 [Defluviitaleaceae bacterium]|nr:hypothetical protein [Defluviitaleaceae bacterium]